MIWHLHEINNDRLNLQNRAIHILICFVFFLRTSRQTVVSNDSMLLLIRSMLRPRVVDFFDDRSKVNVVVVVEQKINCRDWV